MRDAAWMDAERKRVIAREYLTHIGEAKQCVTGARRRTFQPGNRGRALTGIAGSGAGRA